MTFQAATHSVAYDNKPQTAAAAAVTPELYCTALRLSAGPIVDTAELLWHYGTIDGSYVSPLNIVGKFAHVNSTNLPGDMSDGWVGYVVGVQDTRGAEETVLAAQRITAGDQRFAVVGLEWFLGRNIISDDFVNGSGGQSTIKRAIGFNTGSGDARTVEFAEAANKSTGGLYFELGQSNRELWSVRDALRYLLAFHSPLDKDGNKEPIEYELQIDDVDLQTYLDAQPCPPIRTENRSTLQIIDALLSPNRGLGWHLVYEHAGASKALIKPHSQAVLDTALPGGLTLPENANKAPLDADAIVGLQQLEVEQDFSRRYDKVVVRGARRRAVFTASIAAGTLEKGWSAAQETAYKAGASGDPGYGALTAAQKKRANDRVREKSEYERVYSAFRIPSNWDGLSNDGSAAGGKEYACPEMQLGTLTIDGGEPLNVPGFRLLTTLPMFVGWDYTNATSPVDNSGSATLVQQRPFAVLDVGDGATVWRFADSINTTDEELSGGGTKKNKTSYRMFAMHGEPGLQLQANNGAAHSLALGHYVPSTDPPSTHAPEVDYANLRVTVCGEWDSYCEAHSPQVEAATDPQHVLYLDIGERARLDYLAENTIWDCRDGALQTVTTGGPLRDDRDLCWQIAFLAHTWYGDARGQMSFVRAPATVPAGLNLGGMITDVGTGAAAKTVNAVISQIVLRLHNNDTCELVAGFSDLDFGSI